MFIFPLDLRKGKFPLDWKDTQHLPWGILILFGGGLALAAGLSKVGMIDFVGNYISSKEDWSIFVVSSILIFMMLFMTELIGNVALVTILVPLVAGIALGMDAPLLQMVIPVTLASSCAFMLPMATPPNAIVFASGHIKVLEMARAGFFPESGIDSSTHRTGIPGDSDSFLGEKGKISCTRTYIKECN